MGIFLQSNVQLSFLSWILRPAAAMHLIKDHNLILLREILLFEPYSQSRGNPELGRVWEHIAASLNGQREGKIFFKVSQRSVRDRFNILKNKFAKQQMEEKRASAIWPKISEVDEHLEHVIEGFKERDENQRKENEGGEARRRSLKVAEKRKAFIRNFYRKKVKMKIAKK